MGRKLAYKIFSNYNDLYIGLVTKINEVSYYKIAREAKINKFNITCIHWTTFSNFKYAINFGERNSKPKVFRGKMLFS